MKTNWPTPEVVQMQNGIQLHGSFITGPATTGSAHCPWSRLEALL